METVLDYKKPISASLRHSYDIVLDCHGGLAIEDGDRLIRPGGGVLDVNPDMAKRMKALFSLRRKIVFGSLKASLLQRIVDLAARGDLRISIAHQVNLEESISLIARLEAGERAGEKQSFFSEESQSLYPSEKMLTFALAGSSDHTFIVCRYRFRC